MPLDLGAILVKTGLSVQSYFRFDNSFVEQLNNSGTSWKWKVHLASELINLTKNYMNMSQSCPLNKHHFKNEYEKGPGPYSKVFSFQKKISNFILSNSCNLWTTPVYKTLYF